MLPGDVHGFLRSRRSIRRCRKDAVLPPLVEKLIETAGLAPSAHNRQPWRYVVITSQAAKASLATAMGEAFRHDLLEGGVGTDEAEALVERSKHRIQSAPVVVCLCADFGCADIYPDTTRQAADSLMLIQDTALSGMQFMLAAHGEGLGTVWMCAPLFAPGAVRRALALPDAWEPQGLILVGFPDKIPAARERKPVSEIAFFR